MSIQLIRTILEILYFLCAPIIAIAAIYGLRQLNISKEISRISAKRESYRLAAEQCKFYAEVIMPLHVQLYKLIEKEGIKYFDQAKLTITSDSISCSIKAVEQEEFAKLIKLVDLMGDCASKMEAFALFMVSGVADEQISFMTVGESFCRWSRTLIMFLFITKDSINHREPLLQLFLLWNAKIEKQRLANEKKDLENRIDKIQVKSVRSIGT